MKRLTEFDTLADPSFSQAVIDWQRAHGRHALPWQNTRDAYRVWLSEIMLQQTQVAAVLGYYARFPERFPTVQTLAAAPVEDVMACWSGLGYYTRARNLHACAIRVVREHGSVFPADPAMLAELPGIGRSTAAAITAFSNGTRAAILDGNVKRVFARVFGVDGYPGEKRIEEGLWRRAEALLPVEGIEAYTQGLMDLGATLCTRSRPDCGRCPLQARCVAHATGRTAELPVRKPKKATPEKRADLLVVVHDGHVLLEQRPSSGIWGGLLSLPEVDGHLGIDTMRDGAVRNAAIAAFGAVEEVQALLPLVHVFTHYKLHIHPHKVTLAARPASMPGQVWVPFTGIEDAALPAPVKKLLLDLTHPSLF
ncbi:A/G-specific adenine glycosylase [Massilia sp. Dwa41.01b]|uniref:A/G-specific adenine glycosylase n=1 Tax=unclassified Massilia TaxID=2609279 RepID=UPI00160364B3|nr:MULTISPECIES: A/G-specific adenine glycosylase [unclassified Massilia]QNA87646.1 A/G-specific adenine glycosylase [Massilia sp. Dwa41.01b]QNA98552.1 A/G-specific adenine glycosylase [Massilia sp. Se16.2.3]